MKFSEVEVAWRSLAAEPATGCSSGEANSFTARKAIMPLVGARLRFDTICASTGWRRRSSPPAERRVLRLRSLEWRIRHMPADCRRSVRYPVSTLPGIEVDGGANL
jgi:hypothetical protein